MVSDAFEAFYEAHDPSRLSQGDLVLDVPWGLVEAPLRIVRPHQGDATLRAKKTPFGPPGDFPDAFQRVNSHNKELIFAWANRGPCMVLWHGCQIDKFEEHGRKPESWFAGVAPVLKLEQLHENDRTAIKNGQHRSFFFLPAFTMDGFAMPDSYVDLRHIWSVRQSLLTNRVATLGTTARLNLYDQLFVFFARLRLKPAGACPQCGAEVPIAAMLEDVAEMG